MTDFVTQLRRRVPLPTTSITEVTVPTPHRDGTMGRVTYRYGLCRIVRWHVIQSVIFYHPKTDRAMTPFSTRLGSFWRRATAERFSATVIGKAGGG